MELRERETAWSKTSREKPSEEQYKEWVTAVEHEARESKQAALDADDVDVVQIAPEPVNDREPRAVPTEPSAVPSALAASATAARARPRESISFAVAPTGGHCGGIPSSLRERTPEQHGEFDLGALLYARSPSPRSKLTALLAATEAEELAPPSPATEPAITNAEVQLGGYAVVGFEYTPWGEAFPELRNLGKGLTRARLTLRLAMAWVSTRHMLAQYLRFCAQHFPEVSPAGLSAASAAFQGAIGDVTEELLAATRQNRPLDPPHRLERKLLSRLDRRRFDLLRHYEYLKDIYPWLKLIPFGVVPVYSADGFLRTQRYRTSKDDAISLRVKEAGEHQYAAATLLERGALRLYPVLTSSRSGEPRVFWTSCEFPDANTVIGSSLCVAPARPDPELSAWRATGKLRPEELLQRAHEACASLRTEIPLVHPALPQGRLWSIAPNPVSGALSGGVPQIGVFRRAAAGDQRTLVQSIGVLSPGTEREQLKTLMKDMSDWQLEKTHRVSLVPVDYTDAKNAGDSFPGGGAMWFESRTDAIIEGIRALGQ